MRKPKPFTIDGWYYAEVLDGEYIYFHAEAFRHDYMDKKNAKRLSRWLIRAVEWVASKETR